MKFKTRLARIALALLAVPVIVAVACGGGGAAKEVPKRAPQAVTPVVRTVYEAPPPFAIDPLKNYTATVELAKGGNFIIQLHAKETPVTVNNFVFLAREGYYDGLTFHQVVGGYFAQGGSPDGTVQGNPGYFIENEFRADLRHSKRGTVSMANQGIVDGHATNGSQFFIIFVAVPQFDGLNRDGTPKDCAAPSETCHTVFGQVIEGMDNVRGLFSRDPLQQSPADVIASVTINES